MGLLDLNLSLQNLNKIKFKIEKLGRNLEYTYK